MLGILLTPWMKAQGIMYYFYISVFDLLIIISIIFRPNICLYLSRTDHGMFGFLLRPFANLAKAAHQTYNMIGQEMLLVVVYAFSILLNMLSFIEKIARNEGINSMLIWYSFAPMKLLTWVVSVLAITTAAMYAYKGMEEEIYTKKD
ncbi:hypothetical protein [Marinibactrum halimedae]|nr:hypothetical protein [Marinibactrum halimedae]MCD9457439.1 hypothetical protein [Marinibactrum halimedae]